MMEVEKMKQSDEDENYKKDQASKKIKKVKRKKNQDIIDKDVLKCGSEKLITSKKDDKSDKTKTKGPCSEDSKQQKKKKQKKSKDVNELNDQTTQDKKKKKKKKRKSNEMETSKEKSKDINKEFEDFGKKMKKDENHDDENGKKKQHKKKKKSSKHAWSEESADEVKSKEENRSKLKDETDYAVGQWGNASFDTAEQKNKFIRLLGGYKNKAHETSDKNLLSGLKKFNSAAMNKSEEEKLNKKLETQYQQAFDTSRKRKGFGLGYDESHDTKMKTFHIDIEQKSKSIKFE